MVELVALRKESVVQGVVRLLAGGLQPRLGSGWAPHPTALHYTRCGAWARLNRPVLHPFDPRLVAVDGHAGRGLV